MLASRPSAREGRTGYQRSRERVFRVSRRPTAFRSNVGQRGAKFPRPLAAWLDRRKRWITRTANAQPVAAQQIWHALRHPQRCPPGRRPAVWCSRQPRRILYKHTQKVGRCPQAPHFLRPPRRRRPAGQVGAISYAGRAPTSTGSTPNVDRGKFVEMRKPHVLRKFGIYKRHSLGSPFLAANIANTPCEPRTTAPV